MSGGVNEEIALQSLQNLLDTTGWGIGGIWGELQFPERIAGFSDVGFSGFGPVVLVQKSIGQSAKDSQRALLICFFLRTFFAELLRIACQPSQMILFSFLLLRSEQLIVVSDGHAGHRIIGLDIKASL